MIKVTRKRQSTTSPYLMNFVENTKVLNRKRTRRGESGEFYMLDPYSQSSMIIPRTIGKLTVRTPKVADAQTSDNITTQGAERKEEMKTDCTVTITSEKVEKPTLKIPKVQIMTSERRVTRSSSRISMENSSETTITEEVSSKRSEKPTQKAPIIHEEFYASVCERTRRQRNAGLSQKGSEKIQEKPQSLGRGRNVKTTSEPTPEVSVPKIRNIKRGVVEDSEPVNLDIKQRSSRGGRNVTMPSEPMPKVSVPIIRNITKEIVEDLEPPIIDYKQQSLRRGRNVKTTSEPKPKVSVSKIRNIKKEVVEDSELVNLDKKQQSSRRGRSVKIPSEPVPKVSVPKVRNIKKEIVEDLEPPIIDYKQQSSRRGRSVKILSGPVPKVSVPKVRNIKKEIVENSEPVNLDNEQQSSRRGRNVKVSSEPTPELSVSKIRNIKKEVVKDLELVNLDNKQLSPRRGRNVKTPSQPMPKVSVSKIRNIKKEIIDDSELINLNNGEIAKDICNVRKTRVKIEPQTDDCEDFATNSLPIVNMHPPEEKNTVWSLFKSLVEDDQELMEEMASDPELFESFIHEQFAPAMENLSDFLMNPDTTVANLRNGNYETERGNGCLIQFASIPKLVIFPIEIERRNIKALESAREKQASDAYEASLRMNRQRNINMENFNRAAMYYNYISHMRHWQNTMFRNMHPT